jgi:hypothetical protein
VAPKNGLDFELEIQGEADARGVVETVDVAQAHSRVYKEFKKEDTYLNGTRSDLACSLSVWERSLEMVSALFPTSSLATSGPLVQFRQSYFFLALYVKIQNPTTREDMHRWITYVGDLYLSYWTGTDYTKWDQFVEIPSHPILQRLRR